MEDGHMDQNDTIRAADAEARSQFSFLIIMKEANTGGKNAFGIVKLTISI